ncbi:E3 ubiquitin-protein ligase Fancl [Armigeres subalbatus]|uniref:E3 ubiquitin-protein ligase Fancl n=1 Tax=Armigeres subalbatus TaxID=124917 RepID=UPI002ED6B1F6
MCETASKKANFLQKYSFLAEINSNRFVGCYDSKYMIHLALPEFPETSRTSIAVFAGLEPVDVKEMLKMEDTSLLLDDVIKYLDKYQIIPRKVVDINVDSVLKVFKQLEKIKSDHSCKIFTTSDMSKIKLTGFKSMADHSLEMMRTGDGEFQVTSHSLPDLGSSIELFKWHASPEAHASSFVQILEQLEEFYSNMHTLDELCHVVEPAHIDTRCTWRIIRFNQKVFLKITLHPLQPSSVVVAFLGPTIEVEYLRELYNGKLHDWDPESDVYTNLLRIFEIMAFPMRIEQPGNDEEVAACGICMSYRDDQNKIPIISCDNEKCSLIFHIGCLKEWFMSLKDSRTFFAISVGTCPYCKQKVSSSFDELLNNLELNPAKSA